jgi:transposase
VHLVELGVMEQRYQAVMAVVQDGWKITEVADRLGVSRQAVHKWIARYEQGGLSALADRSHRPQSCAHQISPELEALICELRRQHPGWGPRRILHELGRKHVDPLPGRSSIYRCLKRHNLIELRRRKKRRDEFRRWAQSTAATYWLALDFSFEGDPFPGPPDPRACAASARTAEARHGAADRSGVVPRRPRA